MSSAPRLPTTRAESMAYPPAGAKNIISKVQYYVRRHNQVVMTLMAVLLFVIIFAAYQGGIPGGSVQTLRGSPSATHFGGANRLGYFFPSDAIIAKNKAFHFAAITDLDEMSRVEGEKKPTFLSVLALGKLEYDGKRYQIQLGESRELRTQHNEAGRGAEFSELQIYQNRLYTFDDRTGDVFEILNDSEGKSFVTPRFVITEGDGETDKGMKWEWATVKNNELYMGSMGKAYTLSDGSIKNRNNLYIAILNNRGEIRRENWTEQYDVVRKAVGAMGQGYVIMEAVLWSQALRKWLFLPRRISSEMYNDVLDEKRGSNKLVLINESFTKYEVINIQLLSMDPLKGFSSFAFVPGTGDKHAIAIRSVEDGCAEDDKECKQSSYFIVFDVTTGEVLSDEVKYPEGMKFEGIEFVNMYAKPPL